MGIGKALCLALIVGCAHQPAISDHRARIAEEIAPRSPVRVSPAESLQPKPWAVGQWATYKLTLEGETAYDRLSIVAEDACGTWVELVRETAKHRDKWLACVRADEQGTWRTRERFSVRDGAVTRVSFDGKPDDRWPVAGFLPPPRPEGAIGESIDVAAGHFEGAVRVGADWIHPSVPFAGRVKTLASDGTSELVAYGDTSDASVVRAFAELRAAERSTPEPARAFLSIGTGFAKPLGYRHDETGAGVDVRIRAGGAVSDLLDLYGEAVLVMPQLAEPDPAKQQSTALYLFGAKRAFGENARGHFSLRAGIGIGTVSRTNAMGDATTDYGFGASIGAGVFARVIHWCGVLSEVTDDMVITGGGVRHGVGVHLSVQVAMPWFWH